VLVVSDANLRRYGIPTSALASAMAAPATGGTNGKVSTHCVLIGQLGREAERLVEALPPGRAHLCMKTEEMVGVFRDVLRQEIEAGGRQ